MLTWEKLAGFSDDSEKDCYSGRNAWNVTGACLTAFTCLQKNTPAKRCLAEVPLPSQGHRNISAYLALKFICHQPSSHFSSTRLHPKGTCG